MRLLEDVCLIGSEILAPVHLSARILSQQVMNSSILKNSSVIVYGSVIGSHRWQKTVEK